MNLLTALEIQGNGENIKCSAGGPSAKNGKYTGWISLWRDGHLHKELVSTNATFDTPEAATEYMEWVVSQVRQLELKNPLEAITS